MNMKNSILLTISVLFAVTYLPALAQTPTEQIQISLNYPNGDRVDLSDTKIIIFKENEKLSELEGNSNLQFFDVKLPRDNHYKVEVFIEDMFSGYQIFAVDRSKELHISIPFSSGVQFNVFYNDGQTPIPNAKVILKTKNSGDISQGYTDLEGKTMRFWIPSVVNEEDYYVPEVHLGDKLVFYPETIRPDSGSSQIKVITKWPKYVESALVSVYTSESKKLSDSDGVFFVSLFENENKIEESKLIRGDAHFSNIKVGEYKITISKLVGNNTAELDNHSVIFNEKDIQMNVFLNQTSNNSTQLKQSNNVKINDEIIENFQASHKWKKQSIQGIQSDDVFHFISGDQSLRLETEGDGKAVFSRSPKYSSFDLSDKTIVARVKVDNSTHLKELSFSFSDDDTKSNWYIVQIDPSTITSGKWQDIAVDLSKGQITGMPNIKSINKIQVRIADNNQKVILYLNEISVHKKDVITTKLIDRCNCVAFRLDDIQDFWLDDVQLNILETFKRDNTPITIGIIGNSFGDDKKLVDYIKKELETQEQIEVANHGWKHEDFTLSTYDEQLDLLQKTNKKISETLLKKPTVFIPPMNQYNNDTIKALKEAEFTYFSSEIDKSSPPYKFSGLEIYQFPETAVTGNLNSEGMLFLKIDHMETLSQIEYSNQKYGFAVVTLHPQEFSVIKNGTYVNEIDSNQFNELKELIKSVKDMKIKTVLISKINSKDVVTSKIPSWVKNNAGWWADGKIDDNSFVLGIQFLIKEKIIDVPQTAQSSGSTSNQIPSWIKNNAKWWSTGEISEEEFLKGIEFLIHQGVIRQI